jgi:hypothetical protein
MPFGDLSLRRGLTVLELPLAPPTAALGFPGAGLGGGKTVFTEDSQHGVLFKQLPGRGLARMLLTLSLLLP